MTEEERDKTVSNPDGGSLVFLKSAGGEKQILTGVDSLKIFYKKKEGEAKL